MELRGQATRAAILIGRLPRSRALSDLPGVFWTHTPGAAGQPDFDTLPEYGEQFRQLASYYWSRRITPPITVREPFPCIAPVIPFLGGSQICPFCAFHTPQPWIAFPALTGCPDVSFDRPFVQLGLDPLEPIPGLELRGLDLFVNDPGPWVAASETGRWLGDEGLRYAKLDSSMQVSRVLVERAGAFFDLKSCPQSPCEIPFAAEAASAAASSHAPLPREGHAAVLSARRQALWIVGGRAVSGTGGELRDFWRYDLTIEQWRSMALPPGFTLGRVLAAARAAASNPRLPAHPCEQR